jgi:hypothetical protein
VLLTNSKHSSTAEINVVLNQAELIFTRISTILGEDHTSDEKITLLLEGPFVDQGPYFDTSGIHLFRYSSEENGYLALLAHEMVHAFQKPFYIEKQTWNWPSYNYFDEAFAEYIAQLAEPEKTGFPFYGYPENVIVGHMVVNEKQIAHEILRNRHEEFNQPCNLQTYPERASWLRHIDEIYGREALFSIIYPAEEPTSSLVENLIGVDLLTLDKEWEAWITKKYNKIEKADSIAYEYLKRTSWYTYCDL